jgi:hypothetical protein
MKRRESKSSKQGSNLEKELMNRPKEIDRSKDRNQEIKK